MKGIGWGEITKMKKKIIKGVYFEITSKCNLHCPYCYHGDKLNEVNSSSIMLDVYLKVIKDVVDLGGEFIHLSGGEPFLHNEIINFAKIAKYNNLEVKVSTNGTNLSSFETNELSLIDEISIAIDGVNADEHDSTRGSGSFSLVEKNLYKMKKGGIINKITLAIILRKNNYNKIVSFINYALKWNVLGINFDILHDSVNLKNNFFQKEQLNSSDVLAAQKEIEKCKARNNLKLDIVPPKNIGGDCPFYYDEPLLIRIDYNGNVFLCQGFCGDDFSVGNINQCTLKEILYSSNCNETLNFFKNRINLIEECQRCFLKNSFCKGGCVADAYYIQNDCLCTDGWCDVRMKKFAKQLLSHKR